jgi:hypothetical protein
VVEIQSARRSNGILLAGIVLCVAIVLALSRMFASSPEMIGDLSCGPSESSESASHREPVTSPPAIAGASATKESATSPSSVEGDSERRASNPSAMIDGVIVDARTQEPVPFLDVKLVSTPVEDSVRTDKDGAFHSTRAVPLAHLSAVVSDGGRMLKTFVRDERERTDVPWRIELAIGPTYPLVIDTIGALDPSQWTARVLESTRNFDDAGEIDVDERGLTMRAPVFGVNDREWQWLALRTEPIVVGDVPWIRYPSVQFEPEKGFRLRVQVKSDVAGQTGLAHVRTTVGVQEPVIVDGLREVGVIEGRVVDENDAPVSGGTVMLLPRLPTTEGDHTPTWDVVRTNRAGEFRFEQLAIGQRELLAFAPRLPIRRWKLVITRGVTKLFEPVSLPGTAAGSARADEGALIDLIPVDKLRSDRLASDERTRRGSRSIVVHVRLPEATRFARDWVQLLPESVVRSRDARLDPSTLPYSPLDIESIDLFESPGVEHPSVVPTRIAVPAPSARIEFGARSSKQPRPLHVDVRDDPVDAKEIELTFEPGGAIVAAPYASKQQGWDFVPGSPLRWTAWRRGFAPVFGDETAFTLDKETARRASRSTPLTAHVELAPGWGAVLWCRASEGASPASLTKLTGLGYAGDESDSVSPMHKVLAAPPLPDVRVLADGVFAGKSDAEGVIRIALRRQPLRLVLVADHWHMTLLERVPQAAVSAQRYIVCMDRDE